MRWPPGAEPTLQLDADTLDAATDARAGLLHRAGADMARALREVENAVESGPSALSDRQMLSSDLQAVQSETAAAG